MGPIRLGIFYLQEKLAAGGSADVWRAVHPASSLSVAVKLLREPIDRGAVAREARALASLLHPAIVRIVDQGEVLEEVARAHPAATRPGQPYLVMELGETSLWARPPAPGWRHLRPVLDSLLQGLAHAHARGVIHRDLKPSNVLWVQRGNRPIQVAIADFGLARLAGGDTWFGAGTPRYMAPEQRIEGAELGPWTDLYALGAMARELAVGEDGTPRFEVPAGFEAWLARLTDVRPLHRLSTAAEAVYALRALGDAADPGDPAAVAPLWGAAGSRRSGPDSSSRATAPAGRRAGRPAPIPVAPLPAAEGRSEPVPLPLRCPVPPSWREPLELGPIHVVGAGLGLYGFRALPIVGREAERDALWSAFREVAEGEEARSRAVFLTGGAGVGKTALASWLQHRAVEVTGAEAPSVRVEEADRPGAALLVGARRWLGAHLERTPDEVRGVARRSMTRMLGALAPDELEAVTRAISLDGMDAAPTPAERHRIAISFLAHVSERRPVVMLLDELQWDETSVRFLEWLLEARARVLVVATVSTDVGWEMPERLRALLRHASVQEVPVPVLPPTNHARLVRELLGLSESLASRVEERTGGNPMFAVQLVGDWVSRGVLSVVKASLVLSRDADQALPDDLHALWMRRVARMTAGHAPSRDALELAAVLGLDLSFAQWSRAAEALGAPLEAAFVARALASHLLVASADGRELRFAHGMLRESLLRRARDRGRLPRLHCAAADALGPAFEADRPAFAEPLARHLRAAQRLEEALDVMVVASEQAIVGGRPTDALELLDDADDLARSLSRPPDDRAACQVSVLRARALNRAGRLDAAAAAAAVALRKLGRRRFPDLEARALHELGYTDLHRGKSDLAISHFTRAIETMETLEHDASLSRCLLDRSEALQSRGEFTAARKGFQRSLEVSRAIGHRVGVANSLLGLSLPGVGVPGQAEEARRIFEEVGHCSGACAAINALAESARQDGRLAEAEALYRRARRWARMGGVTRHEHSCGLNLALTMLAGERYEEAFVETELGAMMTGLLGQRLVYYMHEVVAVTAAIGAGRWVEAAAHLEAARQEQARVDHADADMAWVMRLGARLASSAGRWELARGLEEISRVEHERLGAEGHLQALGLDDDDDDTV